MPSLSTNQRSVILPFIDKVNNHLSVTLYSEEQLLKLGKNRKEQKYFGIYTKNRSE